MPAPPAKSPGQLSALLADLARVPEAAAPEEAAAPLVAGGRIGPVELVRELGRGSFGVVFEARHEGFGHPVAVKLVRPGRAGVASDQLEHEVDTISRLSHPNLVALLDAGRSEHGPYLVLELLRGQPLKERLLAGALPPAEAVRTALEVARGLAHAHGRGVVHRDLKPSNVFVCEDGSIRVLDFGLAHAFGRRRMDGGSPDYMAPEQWRGAPEDERTDVFALGVLLYAMLSGELPFPRDDGKSATSGQPAPAIEVAELPGLGALVARMLEKDPVDRPRDAGEVVAALEALQSGDGSSSGSRTSAVRVRRRTGRRRALAAAVLLAVLGAGGLVALVGRLRPQASSGTPASSRSTAPPSAASADVPGAGTPSLAVLPFEAPGSGSEGVLMATGISDGVRGALAQIEALKVTGRTSSLAVAARATDLQGVGRTLGVGAVLRGRLEDTPTGLRLSAELLEARDGRRLWSATIERPSGEVVELQEQVTTAVVEALQIRLVAGRAPTGRAFRSKHPRVLPLYLKAKEQIGREADGDWPWAQEALERSVRLDPGYAPAWAAMATAIYFMHGQSGPDRASLRAARARALAAAERAVALAPELSEAYLARGQLRTIVQRDWRGGQADLDRAITLSPSDSEALWVHARIVLAPLGRLSGALAELRRASELDPLSSKVWSTLSAVHLALNQLAQARSTAERSLELAPRQSFAATYLAMVELLEGHPEEAMRAVRREQEPVFQLEVDAMALHALGRREDSDAALRELTAKHAHDAPYQVASVHAWRGEDALAFEWLDRAIEAEDPGITDFFLDPPFQRLEKDPRYARLVARLGLQR